MSPTNTQVALNSSFPAHTMRKPAGNHEIVELEGCLGRVGRDLGWVGLGWKGPSLGWVGRDLGCIGLGWVGRDLGCVGLEGAEYLPPAQAA